MTVKSTRRLIREGDFVAEVDVHLIEEEGGWSPYLSLEDADKLDAVKVWINPPAAARHRSLFTN